MKHYIRTCDPSRTCRTPWDSSEAAFYARTTCFPFLKYPSLFTHTNLTERFLSHLFDFMHLLPFCPLLILSPQSPNEWSILKVPCPHLTSRSQMTRCQSFQSDRQSWKNYLHFFFRTSLIFVFNNRNNKENLSTFLLLNKLLRF